MSWALRDELASIIEFALASEALCTVAMFYDTRGWLHEGLDRLCRAVTVLERAHEHSPPDRANQVALGHLRAARGWLASRLGQHELATDRLERSLEILRPPNQIRAG